MTFKVKLFCVLKVENKCFQCIHRSVFELLLFFDQKDLHQEPLKQFTVAFQVRVKSSSSSWQNSVQMFVK